MALIVFKCESTCDFTDFSASIYDIKVAARRFNLIHDILRSLSLVQPHLKGLNGQFGANGNRLK